MPSVSANVGIQRGAPDEPIGAVATFEARGPVG